MGIGLQVTFDAADPAALADFWAVALGYVLQPPPPGFASWEAFADEVGIPEERRGDLTAVVDPDDAGPRVLFQKVPEGKTAKNRVHLDVNAGVAEGPGERTDKVEAHVATLTSIGARFVERFDTDIGYWVVMLDPEGNEFCVH